MDDRQSTSKDSAVALALRGLQAAKENLAMHEQMGNSAAIPTAERALDRWTARVAQAYEAALDSAHADDTDGS
jgi:hypothetical protein